MNYYAKVVLLTIGCVLCVQSMADTINSVSGRRWLDINSAIDRDGFWHLGPFEPAIPEVRLTDLTHAHRCPTCKSKEAGR